MDFFGNNAFLQNFLAWLAVISFFTFMLSLLLIPWFIATIPVDYFLHMKKTRKKVSCQSVKSLSFLLVRNAVGLFLLCAGTAMLFLPGQGILTLLAAILLLSFPGKSKLITLLINRRSIQRSLDWLRIKKGRQPFQWPQNSQ